MVEFKISQVPLGQVYNTQFLNIRNDLACTEKKTLY